MFQSTNDQITSNLLSQYFTYDKTTRLDATLESDISQRATVSINITRKVNQLLTTKEYTKEH